MPSHLFHTVRDDDYHDVQSRGREDALEITSWSHEVNDYHCTTINGTPDVFASIVVELMTWAGVVKAVSDRHAADELANPGLKSVDELSPLAVDYFRRGFALFGEQASHYAIKAVDNG